MTRNITLDFFKLFLSFCVVAIHLFPLFSKNGLDSWFISNGFCRIAVPCFFFICGYFLNKKIDDAGKIKKYLIHLISIYLVWSFIYLDFGRCFEYWGIKRTLYELFWGFYHLWYVPAMISGIIIFYFLRKYIKNINTILIIGILLFFIGYIGESLSLLKNIINFRSGVFIGLPFISIGYYIKEKNIVNKIKDIHLILLIGLGFILLFADSYWAYKMYLFRDSFVALIFLCPAITIFIFKHSNSAKVDNVILRNIGSLSAAIYFSHYYVILNMNFDYEYTYLKIPVFLFIALWTSIIIVFINNRLKIFL
jgi:Uncharacterized protein conserved in bacteria